MSVRQRWKQTALHNKIIVVLMAIGTVIAVWQLLLPHTTTPITQRSEGSLSPNIFDNKGSIIIQGDIGQKPSQNLIDAQCVPKMLITTPLSPGETIEALPLWHMPAANGGGGLDQLYIEKGNEFIWPKPKPEAFPTLKGYECKITNYTTDPVFNVWIELQEEFREAIRDLKNPNTMREGKITLKRGWPINVNKIDAGVVNAFIFYVVNYSDEVALLSVPDTLTLTMADEIVRRVRLVHSGPMQFWPQLNLPAMPKP